VKAALRVRAASQRDKLCAWENSARITMSKHSNSVWRPGPIVTIDQRWPPPEPDAMERFLNELSGHDTPPQLSLAPIEILAGDEVVDFLQTTSFDTGMGVAHGSFAPAAAYAQIREAVIAACESRTTTQPAASPVLRARTLGQDIDSALVVIEQFEGSDDCEATVQFNSRKQWLRLRNTAAPA